MKYPSYTVEVAGDTVQVSWSPPRDAPVPTRRKYRMRRLLRVVRAAAFKAARGNIGVPLSPEAHSSLTLQVIQACRDTAKRYAHLRT